MSHSASGSEFQKAVKPMFSYVLKPMEMALLVTEKPMTSKFLLLHNLVLLENGIR